MTTKQSLEFLINIIIWIVSMGFFFYFAGWKLGICFLIVIWTNTLLIHAVINKKILNLLELFKKITANNLKLWRKTHETRKYTGRNSTQKN